MPSDNRRYTAAGLPAVAIGMPGYQTRRDPDSVEDDTLIAATRLVIATEQELAPALTRVI